MLIHSIFESINGEVTDLYQGSLCTFIRMAGCNLRCSYCDTPYAQNFNQGVEWSNQKIIEILDKFKNKNITITGGEPLRQKAELKKLLSDLKELGYKVSLETNGSYKIDEDIVDNTYCVVADYKLPSSNMEEYMFLENFEELMMGDFIKFVISDKKDFKRALQIREMLYKPDFAQFAFSPCFGKVDVTELYQWLKDADIHDAIINVQLHKIFNMP